MSGGHSANRFRLAIVLALGAAITLGSFWVLEVMRRGILDAGPDSARTEPDFYVENFNFVRISQSSDTQYSISGKRLTHNPQDDSFEIELPIVNSLSAEGSAMTARSQHARIEEDHSKVHMYKNVEVDRPATATAQHFRLESEYLLLLPDDDVMKSDKPVDMTLGTSKLKGTGMYANNATRELQLFGNVHATYQPPLSSTAR